MADTERLKRWFSSNTAGGVLIYVLRLKHPSFVEFWMNDYGNDITVILEDGFTNKPTLFVPFELSFSQTKNSTLQELTVSLDNVDNSFYQALRSIPLEDMNTTIEAEIRFYLDDDLQMPQNDLPIKLQVEKVDAEGTLLQLSLVAPNLRDVKRFLRYNPNRFPTLYTLSR